MNIKDNGTAGEKINAKANLLVGEFWSLYQNRYAITEMLLGKSFREKITDWQLRISNPPEASKKHNEEEELYKPWFSHVNLFQISTSFEKNDAPFGETNNV
ncbi:hypothetical protein [Phosphitispora sp. TUW77]|uniref:hypothetical protein n=1 Tax=Phosphitispora sp. TUW77 TaxID=3152361 RepID=UPI003AB5D89E